MMELTKQEIEQAKNCLIQMEGYFKEKRSLLREDFKYPISDPIYDMTFYVTPNKTFLTVGYLTLYFDPTNDKWIGNDASTYGIKVIDNWRDIKNRFEMFCNDQQVKLNKLNRFCI